MLVFKAGTHRKANREDTYQIVFLPCSSRLLWLATAVWNFRTFMEIVVVWILHEHSCIMSWEQEIKYEAYWALYPFFSRVFRRKSPVIKIGLSGRTARSWLTFWLTFLQIEFFRKVFNLCASNFTHGFFRVSAFMWCHVLFSWFPIFGWKMHFLEIGIFYIFFSQISVYIP